MFIAGTKKAKRPGYRLKCIEIFPLKKCKLLSLDFKNNMSDYKKRVIRRKEKCIMYTYFLSLGAYENAGKS